MTEKSVSALSRVLCRSGKFETGQGTCAPICMEFLGNPRKSGCGHCERVHGKLAAELIAALSSTNPQDGWLPIETAPVDKPVLAYCTRFEAVCEAINYRNGGWKTFGPNGTWDCRPTHWRPLPAPPSTNPTLSHGEGE